MGWRTKLHALFRKEKLEADMAEEMREHLELRIERNLAAGMSPEEARDAARRSFGGVEQLKERCRDEQGARWLHDLVADVRYGWRQLRKNPGFTAVAVLSLGIGIGANTVIFGVANDFLFEGLPVKNPGELVLLQWRPGAGGEIPRILDDPGSAFDDRFSHLYPPGHRPTSQAFSWRTFEGFRDGPAPLSEVFALGRLDEALGKIDGQAEYIESSCLLVSGNYYSALGVSAVRGRTITAEDDRPGAPPVAVMSHSYWQSRFAGDPAAVGKTIVVNKLPLTIIGITPPDFIGPMMGYSAALTLPLALAPAVRAAGEETRKPDFWWLRLMGRLEPAATKEGVRAALENLFQVTAREGLSKPDDLPHLEVIPGGRRYTSELEHDRFISQLTLPMGMVGLILVAACANVANLLLARGAARRGEVAMRLALGASRGRIVRQLLTESVLLALLGSGMGLLFAGWGLFGTLTLGIPNPGMNLNVLGFTTALAVATGVVFGLVPALRTTRLNLTLEIQGGARHLGGRSSRLSQALIIVQVAISFVLLAGTGLLMRTVANLRAVDVGFETEHLVSFLINPTPAGYPREQLGMFYDHTVERVGALPGVRSVTFARSVSPSKLAIPDPSLPSGKEDDVQLNQVGAGFFETYGMPILLGRSFGPGDSANSPKVAIVNQALAKKYFGEGNPLGQQVRLNGIDREIVGVVRDARKIEYFREPAPTVINIPFVQGRPQPGATVTVRTEGDPATMVAVILQAVGQVDPNVPRPILVRAGNQEREERMGRERSYVRLQGFLGLLALGLASVGLYGLMSYAVQRRTGEIGLRMALGAVPGQVLWTVLGDSFKLIGIGVLVGLVAAAAATRLIASMLYGLSATDPLTYGAVALLLIAVALVACLLPARRAAKVDPMVALRCE